MSWIGGKKSSRDIIIPRFPLYYEKYIEVIGGGGWILFAKPPGNDFEVFNDFNSNISNLYFCVRDKSVELIEKLRFVLNSREDFDRIKHCQRKSGDWRCSTSCRILSVNSVQLREFLRQFWRKTSLDVVEFSAY